MKNRDLLYGGATGLRIICFHETRADELRDLKWLIDWTRSRFPFASPAGVDELCAGRWPSDPRDRVLVTFDDGFESNFEAAQWLWRQGISAIFFVVPSLVDRTVGEYLRFHERFGVQAYSLRKESGARGLSSSQLREMVAMGHRVGAHNFAHRDLGALHDAADIRYEVSNAMDAVAEITGAECADFAIGFGQPKNVSHEATAYLLEHCPRVYAAHRGLNVPGKTPRFLLRNVFSSEQPRAFTQVCMEGGADHLVAGRARAMRARVGVLPPGLDAGENGSASHARTR